MVFTHYLFAMIVGYLIGSIPFGYILVKIIHQEDIKEFGSGNIGATNVYRMDKTLGVITFILDGLKALIAIFFIWQVEIIFISDDLTIHNAQTACLLAGFFAIIGHIYSCFLKFKGGKGVSTMIGYFLYVNILMTAIGLIAWFVCFKFTRYSSLSSLVFSLLCLLYSLILLSLTSKLFVFLVTALVIYQHRTNIKRLINKEETKIN
jgi:glycerol-3-phosphate acyltransferase PlsY